MLPWYQVISDSKLSSEAPGSQWSEADLIRHQEASMTFVGKRPLESDGKTMGSKVAKKLKVEDRRSSQHYLYSWHNALQTHTLRGLELVCPGVVPRAEDWVMPFIVMTLDWHQVQWAALWYLRNKLGAFVEGVPDATHVRMANLNQATAECGEKVTLSRGHVCNNFLYGPWQGHGFSNMLRDGLLDISRNVDENDPQLLHFWLQIRQIHLFSGPEFEGGVGRRKFIDELPNMEYYQRKNVKSSQSRWCSWHHGHAQRDVFLACDRFVWCFIALRKGWAKCLDDLVRKPRVPVMVALALAAPAPVEGKASGSGEPAPVVATDIKGKGKGEKDDLKGKGKGKDKKKDPDKDASLASKKVREEIQQSVNTAHAVARYKMDDDFVFRSRRLYLVSKAEVKAHSKYLTTVLAEDETKKWFAEQTQGAFVDDFIAMIDNLFDLRALAHAGFHCEATDATKLEVSDAIVQCENAHAFSMLTFATSLIKNRAASMSWHTDGYPGLLAALVHDSEKVRSKGLELLKLHRDAVQWSTAQSAQGAEYAARALLHGSIIKEVIKLAETTEFKEMSPKLLELCDHLWSGLLNTVINERGNQKLRRAEYKDCSNKLMGRVKRWDIMRRSGLDAVYKRQRLEVDSPIEVPAHIDMTSCFKYHDPSVQVDLKGITNQKTWESPNSMTIRLLYGELNMMVSAFEKKDPTILSKAWVTGLIPACQMIVWKPPIGNAEAFFALWNSKVSVQTWPLARNDSFLDLKTAVLKSKRLPWRSFTELDELYVMPVKAACPLHALICRRQGKDVKVGVQHLIEGKAISLKSWLSARAFAGIPETTLSKLKVLLDAPDFAVLDGKVDAEEALVVDLVHKCEPNITPSDLEERLNLRHLVSLPLEENDADLTQEVLDDCLLASDRKKAMEDAEDSKEVSKKLRKKRIATHHLVQKLTPKLKKDGKQKPSTAMVKADELKKKHGDRWWASIVHDTCLVDQLKPSRCVVQAELGEGRYLLHHTAIPGSHKSISWTKRGLAHTIQEALRVMWGWEVTVSGQDCPLPSEYIGDCLDALS